MSDDESRETGFDDQSLSSLGEGKLWAYSEHIDPSISKGLWGVTLYDTALSWQVSPVVTAVRNGTFPEAKLGLCVSVIKGLDSHAGKQSRSLEICGQTS